MAAIPVVVNAKSGPNGAETDADAIVAAFREHGLQADVSVLEAGQDIGKTVDSWIAAGAPLIVAGGGDGTINAVASRLVGKPVTLGVLPLGTLNHFARDLGIAFELDAAAAVIAAGHAITVDVGQVNDRVFLNNSSLGLYPRIVTEREQAQRHLGHGKWPALMRATVHALQQPKSLNTVICVDEKEIQRRTPFIFVGNNAYVLEGFGIGHRKRLDAGRLSIYVLRPKSALGFLWMGLRALFGIGSHAGDFDEIEATDFRVEAQPGSVEVATDGEVNDERTPLQYRIRAGALRVLAPVDTPATGGSG